jgi:hypothetical protein
MSCCEMDQQDRRNQYPIANIAMPKTGDTSTYVRCTAIGSASNDSKVHIVTKQSLSTATSKE